MSDTATPTPEKKLTATVPPDLPPIAPDAEDATQVLPQLEEEKTSTNTEITQTAVTETTTEPVQTEPASPAETLPAVSEIPEADTKTKKGKKKAKREKAKKPRKSRKKLLWILVVVALLAGLAFWKLRPQPDALPAQNVMTAFVTRGAITSIVEGNGQAKPKNSESLATATSGTVRELYVSEGQMVTAGTVLYTIDSPSTDESVKKAQEGVQVYQKQINTQNEAKQKLTVHAPFGGKLLEVKTLKAGDSIGEGETIARLVDDSTMLLTQYYSYAYEDYIYIGMPAEVSLPSVMQQLSGTVSAVRKVERISAEGTRLFAVDISIQNPGTLSEKLTASAMLPTESETIAPYEAGELAYTKVSEVKASVSGKVTQSHMQDYMSVSSGQLLVSLSGEDIDKEISNIQDSMKTAQDTLTEALKNKEKLRATAPIDGMVVGLNMTVGEEIQAGTAVLSIVDSSQILVEAAIDERNINYVHTGVMAEIDQWGTVVFGTVESVSLNGKFENGMTTFPAKILVDNADGALNPNASIVYRIEASQSNDALLLPNQCVKSVAHPDTGDSIQVVFVKSDIPPDEALMIDGTALGVPMEGYFALPVTIGIADKFNVEILSGVEEDMEVFSQVMQEENYGMFG